MSRERLLVFNCHEAWVWQLDGMDFELHIVVGLKGRYSQSWDTRVRPLPRSARLVTLDEVLRSHDEYYCVVTHSVTELLDVKALQLPKLLLLHTTLEGRAIEERSSIAPAELSRLLPKFLDLVRGHAAAVSGLKARSWGAVNDVVEPGVDPDDYLTHNGSAARGLRICDQFNRKRQLLRANLHEQAFADIPVTWVGHNPDIPGARAATGWPDLKHTLSHHRFYIHTAHPRYEDGFDLPMLEAMAAGLPVIGNPHPNSPVEHEVSGFLSDDPVALCANAERLLRDPELARRMGTAARDVVRKRFGRERFRESLEQSLATAHQRFHRDPGEQVA